jgi:hypothetical protein
VTDTALMPCGAQPRIEAVHQVPDPGLLHPSEAAWFQGVSTAALPVATTRLPDRRTGRRAWTAVSSAPTPSDVREELVDLQLKRVLLPKGARVELRHIYGAAGRITKCP